MTLYGDLIRNTSTTNSFTNEDVIITGGKLGVGVVSPAYPIDVSGTVKATAFIGDGSGLTGISGGGGSSQWTTSGTNIYYASGNVGVGTNAPTSLLHVGAGTTTVPPIKLNSGTLLTTPVAGTIEYDGTTLYATPNTTFGRATIPTMIYTSGIGVAGITLNTNYDIFPTPNNQITLPVGTYLLYLAVRVVVSGSTVSSPLQLNIADGGNAQGTFFWRGFGGTSEGTATATYRSPTSALGTTFTATAASAANPRTYTCSGQGILRITTQGSIIPSYRFSATLTSGTATLFDDNYMIIQSLDTQNAAAFGPVGAGFS